MKVNIFMYNSEIINFYPFHKIILQKFPYSNRFLGEDSLSFPTPPPLPSRAPMMKSSYLSKGIKK